MPTQGNIKHLCTDRFNLLEEDICMFQSKWQVLLLGDFNGRVGESEDVGDVIGMFEEILVIVMVICTLNYSKIII